MKKKIWSPSWQNETGARGEEESHTSKTFRTWLDTTLSNLINLALLWAEAGPISPLQP